jgi:hypothetical protein
MAEEGFKRKLTAILSADVEGYSRLMGEEELACVLLFVFVARPDCLRLKFYFYYAIFKDTSVAPELQSSNSSATNLSTHPKPCPMLCLPIIEKTP